MRWIIALVAILGLVAGGAYAFRGDIALALMERVLERNMASDAVAALPDGLHVGLCGAGAPMPAADRGGPCVIVIAGKRMIIVDSGTGGVRTLARMDFRRGRSSACCSRTSIPTTSTVWVR